MSRLRLSSRVAAVVIASTAVLGVTGCSGIPLLSPSGSGTQNQNGSTTPDDSPGDGGQTVEAACALVQDTITQATDELDTITEQDPSAVVEAMQAAADRIGEASDQITNDEVAALLPELQQMFTQVGVVMGAIGEGDVTRLAEMEELGAQFQQTSERFQALCAP